MYCIAAKQTGAIKVIKLIRNIFPLETQKVRRDIEGMKKNANIGMCDNW